MYRWCKLSQHKHIILYCLARERDHRRTGEQIMIDYYWFCGIMSFGHFTSRIITITTTTTKRIWIILHWKIVVVSIVVVRRAHLNQYKPPIDHRVHSIGSNFVLLPLNDCIWIVLGAFNSFSFCASLIQFPVHPTYPALKLWHYMVSSCLTPSVTIYLACAHVPPLNSLVDTSLQLLLLLSWH